MFQDVAPGAAAVIAWMDARSCKSLRYAVYGSEDYSDFEDEMSEQSEDEENGI